MVGRSAAIRSRSARSSPCSTSRAIAAPNAPTPGSMTCDARGDVAPRSSLTRGCRAEAPERRQHRGDVGGAGRDDDDLRHSLTSTPLVLGHLGRAVQRHRLAQGQGQRLERGLGAVVVVAALEHVDVQRHAGGGRQRDEEVGQVLGGDVADPLAPEAQIDMRRGPAGEVDHDPGQRLVERRVGVAEAADAAPIAQRLVDGGAQGQRAVLGRVVVVDVEVALAVELEVEPAVLGQRGQHVVEEAQAGLDLAPAPRRRG